MCKGVDFLQGLSFGFSASMKLEPVVLCMTNLRPHHPDWLKRYFDLWLSVTSLSNLALSCPPFFNQFILSAGLLSFNRSCDGSSRHMQRESGIGLFASSQTRGSLVDSLGALASLWKWFCSGADVHRNLPYNPWLRFRESQDARNSGGNGAASTKSHFEVCLSGSSRRWES